MSFANMKKSRGDAIAGLLAAAEKAGNAGGGKRNKDERLWRPSVDKAGNGFAVIRFLPQIEEATAPWVQYWDHGFKGPTGRWYIEKSLTSIGQQDPVSELNTQLWNSGVESDKGLARDRKRRLHYVSNIMVVTDRDNPENEGKVFLYQYGKKIFDKIMDAMQPEFQDETPLNPFDFWEGANFKLKMRQVDGFRNYDKSVFDAPSALLGGDDEKLEAVYNSCYNYQEFIDPKSYKDYDELRKKLYTVLGDQAGGSAAESHRETAPVDEAPALGSTSPGDEIPMDYGRRSDADESVEKDPMSYFAELAKG